MLCDHEPTFLAAVRPLCDRRDYSALLATLRENWPPRKLIDLLGSTIPDVAATAAMCLGISGTILHTRHLRPLLNANDDRVAAAAEDGLWNIWMRAGGPGARDQLALAIENIREDAFESALVRLSMLIDREPTFAEAHHQSALACHALERTDEAELAYRETIRLNPDHFAAWAGLGHVLAERGDLAGTLHAYQSALRINPRLTDLREIVPDLENALRRRSVA